MDLVPIKITAEELFRRPPDDPSNTNPEASAGLFILFLPQDPYAPMQLRWIRNDIVDMQEQVGGVLDIVTVFQNWEPGNTASPALDMWVKDLPDADDHLNARATAILPPEHQHCGTLIRGDAFLCCCTADGDSIDIPWQVVAGMSCVHEEPIGVVTNIGTALAWPVGPEPHDAGMN